MARITIYTDGDCEPNPGRGGWAAILLSGGRRKEISGGEAQTTNNVMELRAILEGLKALKGGPHEVEIISDSAYALNTSNGQWRAKANLELIGAIRDEAAKHQVIWRQVKGHAGVSENERADVLAKTARRNHR